MSLLIEEGATVLFQGDSITDCGRVRDDGADLGRGYAMMAASRLVSLYPERGLTCLNRGIGGNTAAEMAARWQADALELEPDWVSVLIGINDAWRCVNGGDDVDTATYERIYRETLSKTRDALGCRFVICEPFLLSVPAEGHDAARADLDGKIHVCRELAREFGAVYVPFDGLFAAACCRSAPESWAPDGVHPKPHGHALMAQAWLETVGAV